MNPQRAKLEAAENGHATCTTTGKRIYGSRKLARRARNRLPRGHDLNVYRCDTCTGYHIGHMPTAVRNGTLPKEDWLATRRNRQ